MPYQLIYERSQKAAFESTLYTVTGFGGGCLDVDFRVFFDLV